MQPIAGVPSSEFFYIPTDQFMSASKERELIYQQGTAVVD